MTDCDQPLVTRLINRMERYQDERDEARADRDRLAAQNARFQDMLRDAIDTAQRLEDALAVHEQIRALPAIQLYRPILGTAPGSTQVVVDRDALLELIDAPTSVAPPTPRSNESGPTVGATEPGAT